MKRSEAFAQTQTLLVWTPPLDEASEASKADRKETDVLFQMKPRLAGRQYQRHWSLWGRSLFSSATLSN